VHLEHGIHGVTLADKLAEFASVSVVLPAIRHDEAQTALGFQGTKALLDEADEDVGAHGHGVPQADVGVAPLFGYLLRPDVRRVPDHQIEVGWIGCEQVVGVTDPVRNDIVHIVPAIRYKQFRNTFSRSLHIAALQVVCTNGVTGIAQCVAVCAQRSGQAHHDALEERAITAGGLQEPHLRQVMFRAIVA
jgi:hypothetical protein